MLNYYYSDPIDNFLKKDKELIIGEISTNGRFGYQTTELNAWEGQIEILKNQLIGFGGHLFFEFAIPRMGRRVDCLLIIQNTIFVLEFKVGKKDFIKSDIEQVWDYALDLKNFHKPSHNLLLIPVLIATEASASNIQLIERHNDLLLEPITINKKELSKTVKVGLEYSNSISTNINVKDYVSGIYTPTPTIIEAAVAMFNNHNVDEITRRDADAKNLLRTTKYISETIDFAKKYHKKIACFVTGVPGAGKTLVGLKVASEHLDKSKQNTSVFLSGNKPLVDILQESLALDRFSQAKEMGKAITKSTARESTKTFIQIIHHYRDEYLRDKSAPYDHVAIFDEAQRAWDLNQTVKFMKEKKGILDFTFSEPEFLISCLDRHKSWAVMICLVGGGQEINTGEAGISEWLRAIKTKFPNWETRISPELFDSEYNSTETINDLKNSGSKVQFNKDLHLSVSMRSFRAEKLSLLVKQILDFNPLATKTLEQLSDKYPIVITRDVTKAKNWLRSNARGTERYGMVVSSQAYRLRPIAVDVRSTINHVHWFLKGKEDIRSSYFLEEVATEFQVQGLELDWCCVAWDGDFRYNKNGWETNSFKGNKWQNIKKIERKKYLINAYRVLLTRARQGMVILVPEGNSEDLTRLPKYYDVTYNYLKSIGFPEI